VGGCPYRCRVGETARTFGLAAATNMASCITANAQESPSQSTRQGERTVLDHIYISVSDVPRSLAFYAATLEPLGWRELGSYDSSTGPAEVPDLYGLADGAYGSGVAVGSSIWLRQRQSGETGLYVGFVADDEAEVNTAYAAAMEAGGTSEGEPAIRTYFGPSYYAANIADFDDNHLEIVHKSFNPPSRQHVV
jgi:catechol 2,3-dioxygenase-like lactoylglutathione lyase family enzyme